MKHRRINPLNKTERLLRISYLSGKTRFDNLHTIDITTKQQLKDFLNKYIDTMENDVMKNFDGEQTYIAKATININIAKGK